MGPKHSGQHCPPQYLSLEEANLTCSHFFSRWMEVFHLVALRKKNVLHFYDLFIEVDK